MNPLELRRRKKDQALHQKIMPIKVMVLLVKYKLRHHSRNKLSIKQ